MSETGWDVESRDGFATAKWRLATFPLVSDMIQATKRGALTQREAAWDMEPRKCTTLTLEQAMKLAKALRVARYHPENSAPQTFRVVKHGQVILV